jgi:hypothetical protein
LKQDLGQNERRSRTLDLTRFFQKVVEHFEERGVRYDFTATLSRVTRWVCEKIAQNVA